MKILITTGIYPPKIGGPAQYAKNLVTEFEKMGHEVFVKTYGVEDKLPTGIRHLFFFFKIISTLRNVDEVIILDTFSVGLPTILACKIFGKTSVIRTGGDFLWEQYVERTKNKVLLRHFYDMEISNFSLKEKVIFKTTKWVLDNTSKIIFSTEWQRDIFVKAYDLKPENTCIVENYYGEKESDFDYESMIFIASVRKLVWKNTDTLKEVFDRVNTKHPEISLFVENLPSEQFMEKMSVAYAVILVSLGDISPNMILDAVRLNRPFICTKEVGIYERIKDAGTFVDPLNEEEIEKAILNLLTPDGYWKAKEKVRNFNFKHTWQEIAKEFIKVFESCNTKLSSSCVKNIFNNFMIARYFLCGITAATLNIFSLYLFTDILGIWYLLSSILAFVVSLVVSFTLQKFVVFEDNKTQSLSSQFSKFFVVSILGVVTNTILVYLCVEVFGVWYIFSQIIAGFFVMIQNFILYKLFIFNKQ
jgi:putative flippase GtrA/glycosyltransferase involved in cell wall biosynthesis